MNNATIRLKIKQRLNKLASNDYDNLECWQVIEAFNKGVSSWCRRQLHGLNVKQTGDEESKRRIDDLQVILTQVPVQLKDEGLYYETDSLPEDYFEWKKVSGNATNKCCRDSRRMTIYLVEEGNIDQILRDFNKQPNFEWGETVCTLKDNKLRIYTNGEFEMEEAVLSYYRQPRRIEIEGCVDPYRQVESLVDVECEFKDDIIELFIDEAAKILAGDIESYNQVQTANQQVKGNN